MTAQTWSDAMGAALYGPGGFYRHHAPDAHFRTSVSASPLLAESLVRLVVAVDEALGSSDRLAVVDVGAGDGSLLVALMQVLPDGLAGRVDALAVDIRPRPTPLPASVEWTEVIPRGVDGLVIAHEYLDNVPCDVAQVGDDGSLRQVTVDVSSGEESLGPPLSDEQQAWVERWWPPGEPGDRAEIGTERDHAWRQVLEVLDRGVAVAVDYGHTQGERVSGAYSAGTLTAYRDGHQVVPVPDGSCDITAHVAIDACLAAGREAGAENSALLRQADLLGALGLHARRPPLDLATSEPRRYIEGLSRASHAAELVDPASLGSFWWLLQAKGCQPVVDGIDWL